MTLTSFIGDEYNSDLEDEMDEMELYEDEPDDDPMRENREDDYWPITYNKYRHSVTVF